MTQPVKMILMTLLPLATSLVLPAQTRPGSIAPKKGAPSVDTRVFHRTDFLRQVTVTALKITGFTTGRIYGASASRYVTISAASSSRKKPTA